MACVQHAGAIVKRGRAESGSELHALQTLRAEERPGRTTRRHRTYVPEYQAVSMQLEMGSTPAPGVAIRRPRRMVPSRAELPNGECVQAAERVAGEGASHRARGRARSPLAV